MLSLLDDVHDDTPAQTDSVVALLARTMIEAAFKKDAVRTLGDRTGFCLVVKAPSSGWASPIYKYLRSVADWDYCLLRAAGRPRNTTEQETVATILQTLGTGGNVLGVSHAPHTHLPNVLVSAADLTIEVPPVSGKMVAAVIAAVTGARGTVSDDLVRGLGFEEIASRIREGSTRRQCVVRLERMAAKKHEADPALEGAPDLNDLHGYGEAMVWAQNLVSDLASWRRGEIPMSAIQRNVVLASAPGLGKTTFVRSVAKSANIPLISTSVSSWFAESAGHLDAVIKQIDETFQAAQAKAPCLILLDELDGLPARQSLEGHGSSWWTPVVNHMLITLDGALSQNASEVIVVGATNHAEKLDPALTRDGRLHILQIGLPKPADLIGIFRQHLGSDLAAEDLSAVAQVADGATGATVVGWVKTARRAARLEGRPMIVDDLLGAVAPRDDRSARLQHRVALHEAGHAVSAHALGVGAVRFASIVPRGDNAGSVLLEPTELIGTRDEIERRVTHLLAGRAAEELVLGDVSCGSAGTSESDLATSTRMLGMLHLSMGMGQDLIYRSDIDEVPTALARHPQIAAMVEKDLRRLYRRACDVLAENRSTLDLVTDALLRKRHLSGEDFRRLVPPNLGELR